MGYTKVKTLPVDLTVTIFEYQDETDPDWVRYDWRASNGDSPGETFESVADAEEDARSHFS